MLRKQQKKSTSSSSHVLNLLKNFKNKVEIMPYNGVTIKGIGSFALSNLSKNLKNDADFCLKLIFFLAFISQSDGANYFASPNAIQNYKFDSANSFSLKAGDCGTVTVPHAVSYGYESIQRWTSPTNQPQQYSAELFQGAGEPKNQTLVECLQNLVEAQINTTQLLFDKVNAENAKIQASKDLAQTNQKIALSIALGGPFTILALIGFIALYIRLVRYNTSSITQNVEQVLNKVVVEKNKVPSGISREESSQEKFPSSSEDSSYSSSIEFELNTKKKQPVFASKANTNDSYVKSTHSLFTSPITNNEMAERLEKTEFDVSQSKEAQAYDCAVTNKIMSKPCNVKNEKVYEKSVLENLKSHVENGSLDNVYEETAEIVENKQLKNELQIR